MTSFVGREREIDQLAEMVRRPEVRLITLTGPGGIGKTRLAAQLVARIGGAFPDGIATAWLEVVLDPALVPDAVAGVLELQSVPGVPTADHVLAHLRDRRVLLVLDNMERLLEASPFIVDLLSGCPALKIVCTSRARLEVSGEHLFPLPPLDPDAARRLFMDRARAQAPDLTYSDETTAIVASICDRLDRLPLAIELAAARAGVLRPAALMARLDDRLAILTRGPRDAPSRLRNMRATIEWSHNLLGPDEQLLYRRLGVFVGGFTLEAAAAVIGEDALDGVSSLVASSLLEAVPGADGEPRFAMLEVIREDAHQRLAASGEEEVMRAAHLRHFVDRAEVLWAETNGAEHTAVLRQLMRETGNIRAALAWSLDHDPVEALRLVGALGTYWIHGGHLAEGRAWLERAMGAAADAPLLIRTRGMLTSGWLAMDQGDLDKATALLREALDNARALDDEELRFVGLALLTNALLGRGDIQDARSLAVEAAARADTMGSPLPIAISRLNLGQVAAAAGDPAGARALLEEALAAHRRAGGTMGPAITRVFLGDVLLAQGARGEAARRYREAAAAFVGLADMLNTARSLEGLAQADPNRADAVQLLGAADALRAQVGAPGGGQRASGLERLVASLRAGLGDEAFTAAREAGRSWSLDSVRAAVESSAGVADASDPAAAPARVAAHGLTPRELEVLRLLVDGYTNRAIADRLSLSERTAEHHVLHILTKLNLESRAAAAVWAVRHGIA